MVKKTKNPAKKIKRKSPKKRGKNELKQELKKFVLEKSEEEESHFKGKNIIEEIDDMSFIPIQTNARTSPVLERVAVPQGENLEQQLATVSLNENENKGDVKYGDGKFSYSEKSPERINNQFRYEASGDYSSNPGNNKDRTVLEIPRNKWEEIETRDMDRNVIRKKDAVDKYFDRKDYK